MSGTDVCSCKWADCSVFTEQIALHAPDGHHRKSNAYCWRIKTDSGKQCFEKMMLLSAVCHHIPGIAEKVAKGGQSFILARHHFPVSAFDHIGSKKMAVLLSEKEIIKHNKATYHFPFVNRSNKLQTDHNHQSHRCHCQWVQRAAGARAEASGQITPPPPRLLLTVPWTGSK